MSFNGDIPDPESDAESDTSSVEEIAGTVSDYRSGAGSAGDDDG